MMGQASGYSPQCQQNNGNLRWWALFFTKSLSSQTKMANRNLFSKNIKKKQRTNPNFNQGLASNHNLWQMLQQELALNSFNRKLNSFEPILFIRFGLELLIFCSVQKLIFFSSVLVFISKISINRKTNRLYIYIYIHTPSNLSQLIKHYRNIITHLFTVCSYCHHFLFFELLISASLAKPSN